MDKVRILQDQNYFFTKLSFHCPSLLRLMTNFVAQKLPDQVFQVELLWRKGLESGLAA